MDADFEARSALEGRTVGQFEVLEGIGSGGMGVVYKARDTRLGRLVTLKFLHPHLLGDEAANARFIQEAKAASALDHANICTIHDIVEAEDGQVFIAMAYYAGETLKQRLERGPLTVVESVDIARQIASGLERAHAAGIVHRDLKPANVMITGHGEVKILDFGIAKLEGASELTRTGQVMGTVSYMSPEQAQGQAVDHRADIWALGVVLYEMVAGRRPFQGAADHAVVYMIIHEDPPKLADVADSVPESVEVAVHRSLSKDPDDRFGDIREMAAALGRSQVQGIGRRRWPWAVGLGVGTAFVLATMLWYVIAGNETREAPNPGDAALSPAVAILPFDISGSSLEEWREGLVTLLSTGIDGAAGLRTINSRTILALVDRLGGGDPSLDELTSLRIANEAGAQFAVLGSAVAIGPDVRIVADVYETGRGAAPEQRQVEGPPDSVLALVDRLAVEVLGVIFERTAGQLPPVDLASLTTPSVPALKAYLDGEVHSRRAEFDDAIAAYTLALAQDSTFALAHYHMASAHAWREGIQSASARRHREAALRLVDRLPAREAALVRARHATGEQRPDAVALLSEAVRQHPDDAEAWFLLGDAHLHTGALTSPEEADEAFRRAADLDPRFALYQPHGIELGFNLHADSAIAAARLERYGDATNRTAYYAAGRFALDAVFGRPEVQESMLVALDTFSLGLLPALSSFVQHPRAWEVQERVYLAIRDREPPSSWRSASADFLASGSLWKRGKLERAMEYLAHPHVSLVTRVCLPAVANAWGIPVPEDALIGALSRTAREDPVHAVLACQGYLAADLGRWDDHSALVRETSDRAAQARAREDRAAAARLDAAAVELRGYGLWRRGRPLDALPVLREARETPWYLGAWPRRVHKKALWFPDVWPGLIHWELGHWEEAAPYFRRPWYNPFAHFHQGLIQRALGDDPAMRQALEYFVEAWAQADPVLQPWVEEARVLLEGT